MLIGIFTPRAINDMYLLQAAYPKEAVRHFYDGEFLCRRDGTVAQELDGSFPTRISFLDHLAWGMIGGGDAGDSRALISAEDFADILIKQLDRVTYFHGRYWVNKIKDIDLLGCEGGLRWVDPNGVLHEGIAEVIARKLMEAGYRHIKIHTLTPEFIGDHTILHTRLYGGRKRGQPFEFYGFTTEGMRQINAAQANLNRARGDYQQFCNQQKWAHAELQRLSVIPFRRPVEQRNYASALNSIANASILEARHQTKIDAETKRSNTVWLKHRRPQQGTLRGMDLRRALADPRNIITPADPVRFSFEQLKLLSQKLASTNIQIKVCAGPPIQIHCTNELSYLCFRKYLNKNRIPCFYYGNGVIQLTDSFRATHMVCTFSTPWKRNQIIYDVRQDTLKHQQTIRREQKYPSMVNQPRFFASGQKPQKSSESILNLKNAAESTRTCPAQY